MARDPRTGAPSGDWRAPQALGSSAPSRPRASSAPDSTPELSSADPGPLPAVVAHASAPQLFFLAMGKPRAISAPALPAAGTAAWPGHRVNLDPNYGQIQIRYEPTQTRAFSDSAGVKVLVLPLRISVGAEEGVESSAASSKIRSVLRILLVFLFFFFLRGWE